MRKNENDLMAGKLPTEDFLLLLFFCGCVFCGAIQRQRNHDGDKWAVSKILFMQVR